MDAKSDSGCLASASEREPLGVRLGGVIKMVVFTRRRIEFDYVGVISGPSLVYYPRLQDWKGDKTKSFGHGREEVRRPITQMVKNTYRVLLTRG